MAGIFMLLGTIIGALGGLIIGVGLGILLSKILTAILPPQEFTGWSGMAITFWLGIAMMAVGTCCGGVLGFLIGARKQK